MVFRYKSVAAYNKRLKRLEKQIRTSSGKAIQKSAEWTAVRAAMLAPRDTGSLVNNIVWKGSNKTRAEIVQFDPSQENPSRTGKHYNYAMAMAKKVRDRSLPFNQWLHSAVKKKGGDPDYMEHAAQESLKVTSNNVRKSIKDAIRKSR